MGHGRMRQDMHAFGLSIVTNLAAGRKRLAYAAFRWVTGAACGLGICDQHAPRAYAKESGYKPVSKSLHRVFGHAYILYLHTTFCF